ncbi:MAG: nucleolar RNA-binding Nop10p family protein [Promethearchaeota archaeon]
MRLLKKCNCSYTIDQSREFCDICKQRYKSAHPPKFSPYDKYADYRRRMKELAKQKS